MIKVLHNIIGFIAALLFSVLGAVAMPMASTASHDAEFFPLHVATIVEHTNVHFAARAPPTTVPKIAVTGNVTVMRGGAFVTHGIETLWASLNFGADLYAPNRTVTDFIDGVTVVDRRTGTTFTVTVDLRPTLDRIENGIPHTHRNDGTTLQNRPLRGQTEPELPVQPDGYYTEYVHPTPGINGPGPQRIVRGDGGELYYTPDHYQTFIRLDQK